MAAKNERFVGFYDLSLRGARLPDKPVPFSATNWRKVAARVTAARKALTPLRTTLIKDQLYVIVDDMIVDVARGVVSILFTVADTNAADAVYRNLQSGRERRFTKSLAEGGATSAHMVVRLKPYPNTLRYPTALEDVEGVSRSRVLPVLEQIIRDTLGPVTVDTDEGPRQADAVLEIDTVRDNKVAAAAGRPIAAELVRLKPRKSLDTLDRDGYHEQKRTIVFAIDDKKPEGALAALISIRQTQKTTYKDFPLLRIRWKRPDNKVQSLSIDGLVEDLLQRAFTKMLLIDKIFPDMPASMTSIRSDFVAQVASRL